MSRDAFLTRVRAAAERGRAWRVERHELPPTTGYVGARGNLVDALVAEVEAVGGSAQRVADWDEARAALGRLLDQLQARSALVWQHPVLQRLRLEEILFARGIAAAGYDQLRPLEPDQQRATVLAADVGITSADWAIAETGTLVMRARPGQERLVSLLPPVHIAIVAQSQLVADLLDVFGQLENAGLDGLPSNITLITGPSKTGDIELQLTTGVHGPGKWHVLVVTANL